MSQQSNVCKGKPRCDQKYSELFKKFITVKDIAVNPLVSAHPASFFRLAETVPDSSFHRVVSSAVPLLAALNCFRLFPLGVDAAFGKGWKLAVWSWTREVRWVGACL